MTQATDTKITRKAMSLKKAADFRDFHIPTIHANNLFEMAVYGAMGEIRKEGDTSTWKWFELSNGYWFMAPDNKRLTLSTWSGDGVEVSGEAAGLCATLVHLERMLEGFHSEGQDNAYEAALTHLQGVQAYARQHKEYPAIYRILN